jgi:hypothetical protein
MASPPPSVFASAFSGGGTPVADVAAIVLAIAAFALLLWVIELMDRV